MKNRPSETQIDPAAAMLRRDEMGGLVKGLRLIEAFDSAHTRMTLSEAARRVNITPAAARRCLLTLCALGYANTDGKLFWMGHGALRVAYAYSASTRLPRMLQPTLDALCERTRESAALSVLDGSVAVIAARSSARRTMRVGTGIGSRLPLYCSSAGRALMANMPRSTWLALVQSRPMEAMTANTETTVTGLARMLKECQERGYSTCDEEIELGVRSIAVPLYDLHGTTVAAITLSTRAERMTIAELVTDCLPAMLRAQEWAKTRMH
ncbi:MAG: helix-turn-helix domain-containing protein [Polaromonas sp.]|uniref:IclR family transcriptional regulator domain-containing protein n=1 Tax=Polaromonas sp. TaxID=1869339 RepID=UPI0025EE267E|nr:IclR family transcriptional regulator C-terminal domain-containing protein [Polaromonas sp.]MBI2726539.1 helix-turn-helix domain-containing protein [Polaromonas sp.]